MPLQKLSEIKAKLETDCIDIKKRYIKLIRCKYALFFKNYINFIINWFVFY